MTTRAFAHATLALLLALSACAKREPQEKAAAAPRAEAGRPAARERAQDATQVLVVTFEVTAQGYTPRRIARARGVPTPMADQDRAVVLRALDEGGGEVATVTVYNPLAGRPQEGQEGQASVRETGRVTVRFPRPEDIATVAVEVKRGPGAGYEQSFAVPAEGLQPKAQEAPAAQQG